MIHIENLTFSKTQYINELELIDEKGDITGQNDTLTISFQQFSAIPEMAQKLRLYINDIYKGSFYISSVKIYPLQQQLKITAKTHNFPFSKEIKKLSYDNISFEDLVKIITARLGIKYKIISAPPFSYTHISQSESDIAFLQRIVTEQGLSLSIKNETAFISPPILNSNPIFINKNSISSIELSLNARPKYNSVTVQTYDIQSGKTINVSAGSGNPILNIRRNFQSLQEAKHFANQKLSQLKTKKISGSLSIPLSPSISANQTFKTNLNTINNKLFHITKVKHLIAANQSSSELSFTEI